MIKTQEKIEFDVDEWRQIRTAIADACIKWQSKCDGKKTPFSNHVTTEHEIIFDKCCRIIAQKEDEERFNNPEGDFGREDWR